MSTLVLGYAGPLRALLTVLGGGEWDDLSGASLVPLAAIQQGGPAAWQALYLETRDALYRYTMGRLGNAEDAEDVVGEVFERALASVARSRDVGLPARAWLFGIARNLVNGRRRAFYRRPPHLPLELFDGSSGDPRLEPDLLDLVRAIALLPAGHSEVIVLRFFHGLTLAETANILGTSTGSIKSRQFRATTALRKLLDGNGATTPSTATVTG